MNGQEQPWHPDRANMGNWEAMFQQRRPGAIPPSAEPPPLGLAAVDAVEDGTTDDLLSDTYRPWLIQRGRTQPAMMLGLRRFDSKAGLWRLWALSYPSLIAVEALGDRMLSLDFAGARQFMLRGRGLDQLAADLQRGVVIGIVEYAAAVWPGGPHGAVVTQIEPVASGQHQTGP